jgi:hypothetical protein
MGEHILSVLVIDEAGNTVSRDYKVTRN